MLFHVCNHTFSILMTNCKHYHANSPLPEFQSTQQRKNKAQTTAHYLLLTSTLFSGSSVSLSMNTDLKRQTIHHVMKKRLFKI